MQHQQYYQSSPDNMLYKLQNPHEVIQRSKDNWFDSQTDLTIQKVIQSLNFYEEESVKCVKDKVVEEIKAILLNWLNQISKLRITDSDGAFIGDILVFGSYRLSINSKDGDIDMIVLAPSYVDRETHFFQLLPSILNTDSRISNLFLIQEAMVPLIRFRFKNILIDLIFASINKVQKTLCQSDTVDDKSSRSINGLKVSDYFAVRLTYKNANLLMKAIKVWAHNRGIYGGVMGYLGGISWQILTAKIVQMYPHYSVSALLDRFFFIYSQWRWNDMPVLIEKCEDVWRSSYFDQPQQNKAAMIILTPVYPNINSAHNVSNCTLNIIEEQFRLGNAIIQKIKAQELLWGDLFKKLQFFEKYNQYLQIRALSKGKNELIQWKSHIESRLRKLNKQFDEPLLSKHLDVHLYPKGFETDWIEGDEADEAGIQYPFSDSYFYGIRPKTESGATINISSVVQQFCECLEGQKPYIVVPLNLSIQIKVVNKDQIPKRIKQLI